MILCEEMVSATTPAAELPFFENDTSWHKDLSCNAGPNILVHRFPFAENIITGFMKKELNQNYQA